VAGRTFTVGIRIQAEDRSSAQIAKIQSSTRSFEGAVRRLGVTLEKDANAALRLNATILAEAEKKYLAATITLEDYRRIQERVAAQNARITSALQGSAGAATSARGAFSGLTSTLNGLVLRTAAAYVSLTGLGRGLRAAVTGALEQEAAEKRRAIALERAGGASAELVAGLDAQAEALQRTTKFSDNAVIGLQAYLLELGVAAERTKEATQVTLDLASRFDLDLKAAAKGVAGVMRGEVLGRIGQVIPELVKLKEAGLLSAEGFDFLADSMRGAAQAAGETRSGAIEGLKNDLGELGEAFVDGATKSNEFVGGLGNIRTRIQELTPAMQIFGSVVSTVLGGLLTLFQGVGTGIGFVVSQLEQFGLWLQQAEPSAAALEATAARLGISVEQLKLRLESTSNGVVSLGQDAQQAGAGAEALGTKVRTITLDLQKLQAAAAESGSAVAQLGQTLGVVTSVQLSAEIAQISIELEAARAAGELTRHEFEALEAVAQERIAVLQERIRSLQDGLGDLQIVTAETRESFDDLGADAVDAAAGVDRLATAAGRVAAQLDQAGAAAIRNGRLVGTITDPALAAQLGTTSFQFAGGRYTFLNGQRVRVLPNGRIEPA
jgi:hypothetical protein